MKHKCSQCIYNAEYCQHASNKGIQIRYRVAKQVYFEKSADINKDGKCKNYAEFSEK